MKGLLIKDFYKSKKYSLIFLFLYITVRIGAILIRKDYMAPYFTLQTNFMIIFVMITMGDLLKSDKNDGDMAYTLAMPISKKEYVDEKLIFAAILIGIAFLANLFVGFFIKIFTGVNLMDKEFFYHNIFSIISTFIFANFGINFSISIGESGFLLAIFPWVVIILSTLVFFPSDGDLYAYMEGHKLRLVIWLFIYLVINIWLRNSSIKKMNKKRY